MTDFVVVGGGGDVIGHACVGTIWGHLATHWLVVSSVRPHKEN